MTTGMISVIIAIATACFSSGIFVGMLTAKFVLKTECKECRAQIWDRVDSIQDAMTGGKVTFELRMLTGGV